MASWQHQMVPRKAPATTAITRSTSDAEAARRCHSMDASTSSSSVALPVMPDRSQLQRLGATLRPEHTNHGYFRNDHRSSSTGPSCPRSCCHHSGRRRDAHTTGLSSTGQEPATHYISSGWIPAEIIDALTMCAISELPPDEAMTDKGLKPCVSSAT